MLPDQSKPTGSDAPEQDGFSDPYIVALLTELQGGGSLELVKVNAESAPMKLASRRIELLRKNR